MVGCRQRKPSARSINLPQEQTAGGIVLESLDMVVSRLGGCGAIDSDCQRMPLLSPTRIHRQKTSAVERLCAFDGGSLKGVQGGVLSGCLIIVPAIDKRGEW